MRREIIASPGRDLAVAYYDNDDDDESDVRL